MEGNPTMQYKTLVVGIILLFISVGIQPSVAVQPETKIDVEPKDYLFQTIIDIANNPEVKELFEQYDNDLFKVDIDGRVYRKLFLRNPRLLFNTIFSKPSMSVEYLYKCYNNGIEITNTIGEDKVIETIENVRVTDTKLFDELNDIISKDEELSSRLETLKDMNKEVVPDLPFEDYPYLCIILFVILAVIMAHSFILSNILSRIESIFEGSVIYNLLNPIFTVRVYISIGVWSILAGIILIGLDCNPLPDH